MKVNGYVPEQLRRKQCPISSKAPSQNRPLFDGGGLSQTRYLDLYPDPQVVSHGVHAVQSDQLPSTVYKSYTWFHTDDSFVISRQAHILHSTINVFTVFCY